MLKIAELFKINNENFLKIVNLVGLISLLCKVNYPAPKGGALKPKFSKPKTEIPKQVRDDKKREPNPIVMNLVLNLIQYRFSI